MTYKEAIKYFEHRLSCGQCGENTTQRKTFEVALDCINKQIPKKPKVEIYIYPRFYTDVRDDEYDLLCPCCGEYLMEYDHHCKCGQRIDWSDGND